MRVVTHYVKYKNKGTRMFDLSKKDPAQAAPNQPAPEDRDQRARTKADSPASRSQTQRGETAVIGRSIKIDGDLRGEEDLRIEGDISGTIQLPNHSLTIGKEGRVNADAYAKSVTVDGEMNGDLYGSECVNIRANARVAGNVIASRVCLEEGARFKGSIDMDPESVESALGNRRGPRAMTGEAGRPHDATDASAAVVKPKPVSVQRVAGEKKPKA